MAKELNTKQMVSAIFEVGKILEAVDNAKTNSENKNIAKPPQFSHPKDN